MKMSLWPLLTLVFVMSASANPHPPALNLSLLATDLEVLNVMLDNAPAIQDAAKHGNGISRVSITTPNPGTTIYDFRIVNCEGVVGCFGGALLSITRSAHDGTPISFRYEVTLEVLRGNPTLPQVSSVRAVSAVGLDTISAIFGRKANGDSVAENFADLSGISNNVTEGTVARVEPGVTLFRLKSQNCQIRTRTCRGGGRLSITRSALSRPGSPARVVYEAEITRIRDLVN